MQQLITIGKPAPVPSILDMVQQLAQREAEEIRRLKEAAARHGAHS